MWLQVIATLAVAGVFGQPGSQKEYATFDLEEASKQLRKHMDLNADPCKDFAQYSCGGYLAKTPKPKESYEGTFKIAYRALLAQGEALMTTAADDSSFESDRKIRNFYKACMDTNRETIGGAPLLQLFKDIGGWPVLEGTSWKSANWYDMIRRLGSHGMGFEYILKITVGPNPDKCSTKGVVRIDDPGLGYESFFGNRTTYRDTIVKAAVMLGANEATAKTELTKSVDFEFSLKALQKNSNSNEEEMTYRDLTSRNHPYMKDLVQGVVDDLGLDGIELQDDSKVIVKNPLFLTRLAQLLRDTDPRTIANYIGWRVFKQTNKYLSKDFRQLSLRLKRPLKELCLRTIGYNPLSWDNPLNAAAASLYVRTYVYDGAKQLGENILSQVQDAYRSMIGASDWMDDKAKKQAKLKIDKLKYVVSHSDEILDKATVDGYYQDLNIQGANFFKAGLAIEQFLLRKQLDGLRKYGTKGWTDEISTLFVSFYHQPTNKLQVPAGSMQEPLFDARFPTYLNYGALGESIAADLGAAFNRAGSHINFEGKRISWWSNYVKTAYKQKEACVARVYDRYVYNQTGTVVDGKKVADKAIVHWSALKAAHLAYRQWVSKHGEEVALPDLDCLTSSQLFWVSYGQSKCLKLSDEYIRQQSEYPPKDINVHLQNYKGFAEDFQCATGSPMRGNPSCSVW